MGCRVRLWGAAAARTVNARVDRNKAVDFDDRIARHAVALDLAWAGAVAALLFSNPPRAAVQHSEGKVPVLGQGWP